MSRLGYRDVNVTTGDPHISHVRAPRKSYAIESLATQHARERRPHDSVGPRTHYAHGPKLAMGPRHKLTR